MRRFITAIRMGSGDGEEHIEACLVLEPTEGVSAEFMPASIAKLILDHDITYQVGSLAGGVDVVAVKKGGEPHHIRTEANGTRTDNLLQLPHF